MEMRNGLESLLEQEQYSDEEDIEDFENQIKQKGPGVDIDS